MSDRKDSDPLQEVIQHYQEVDEDSRLKTGWCQLELARTQELLQRHLPSVPAVIVDAGGGSGVYAGWLTRLGYEVHLIDPVPKHVEQARAASARQTDHPIASIRLGDARRLELPDQSVDAVLLLGPLYHLTERADRMACLREAQRVLRGDGVVVAVAISRFASLFDSLLRGFFDQPEFVPILERDLQDGQHRNTTGNPSYFTTAYFHRPEELRAELTEVGFQVEAVAAVEGPGWLARDFDRLWAIPTERHRLMACLRRVEHEPTLLGASPHILAVGRK